MKFNFTITGSYKTKEINYPKGTTVKEIIEIEKDIIEDILQEHSLFINKNDYTIKIESNE